MDSRSLFEGAKRGGETANDESDIKKFNLKATATANKQDE